MKHPIFQQRFTLLCFLLSASVLVSGCSTKIKGWSQESYRSPNFSLATLEREGLALLPVIMLEPPPDQPISPRGAAPSAPYAPAGPENGEGGKQQHIADGHRLFLDQILLSKLKTRLPDLQILPSGDSLKRLNDAGLAQAYSRFVQNYPAVGMDASMLQTFGRALNSRYLFISRSIHTESPSAASVTFIWTFGRKTILSAVKLTTQVWDTENEKQLWEGSSVGYNQLRAYENAPLTEQIANMAVDGLLDSIIPE